MLDNWELRTKCRNRVIARVHAWDQVSAFIIGIESVKDPTILVRAYSDSAGVSASFRLNILRRISREHGANFDFTLLEHQARWNTENSHQYTHDRFSIIANSADWSLGKFFTDQDNLFALAVLAQKNLEEIWFCDQNSPPLNNKFFGSSPKNE